MFKKLQGRISTATDLYHTFRKEIKLATSIKLKNKNLAQTLEEACDKRHGLLTYAEYLAVDQFGVNGYYPSSKTHGKTDVENRWPEALGRYCQQNGFDTMIEFGCGYGYLGVASSIEYREMTKKLLTWIGVEIDEGLHDEIRKNFADYQVTTSLGQLTTTLDEIPRLTHPLIVFPYSFDNIPPQIFLNTKITVSYPDTLLGITVKNGMLSEVIIPHDVLRKKGITLRNGIFTQNNLSFSLTSWKLHRGQRAYIPVDAYETLYRYVQKFENPAVVIIDEFVDEPHSFSLMNRATPQSLYEDNIKAHERNRYYRESGKHNFYYPLYRSSLLTFLHALGFQKIDYTIEQKKAAQLSGKPWMPISKKYNTLTYFASELVKKKTTVLPISFNPKRIF